MDASLIAALVTQPLMAPKLLTISLPARVIRMTGGGHVLWGRK